MALRKLVLDGISMELDETQASIVEKVVGDAKKTAADAVADRDKALARATAAESGLASATTAATKAAADHATALAEAKSKIPTEAQLEALGAERASVVADAETLVPDIECAGKSVGAIRTEVLVAVSAGDSAAGKAVKAIIKDTAPDKVTTDIARIAFDTAVSVHASTATDAEAEARDAETGRALAGDGSRGGAGKVRPVTGRDLFLHRQKHGKDPAKGASK